MTAVVRSAQLKPCGAPLAPPYSSIEDGGDKNLCARILPMHQHGEASAKPTEGPRGRAEDTAPALADWV